jgi:hypothetical protein
MFESQPRTERLRRAEEAQLAAEEEARNASTQASELQRLLGAAQQQLEDEKKQRHKAAGRLLVGRSLVQSAKEKAQVDERKRHAARLATAALWAAEGDGGGDRFMTFGDSRECFRTPCGTPAPLPKVRETHPSSHAAYK